MASADQFFLIFLCTILITRIFLFYKPISSPTIGNFRMHHYMYGIAAIIIGLIMNSIVIYAIGLGLFIDELTYLLIKGKTHADNYSAKSLIGTLFFIVIICVLRNHLVN